MHLQDLARYLTELSDNNNRAWFVMNKPRYDILREEFLALVTDLIFNIGKFDPLVIDCNPKKALFRINRDVRFAKDKSPYKTTFSAAIVPGNLKKPSQGGGPMYYFQIDAKGELFFAVGEYMPPADRLKQLRHHVSLDGASLVKLLKDKKLQSTFGSLREDDKLQRPPKGFEADHPYVELIKLKHYMVHTQMPTKAMTTEVLTKTLVSGYKDAYKLVCWLRGASGISK
jgi:uncharacterized protein (TIGR02453 family)